MHGEKQLIIFLIACSVALVFAEVSTRRRTATLRYVMLMLVWGLMVGMLLWSYQE